MLSTSCQSLQRIRKLAKRNGIRENHTSHIFNLNYLKKQQSITRRGLTYEPFHEFAVPELEFMQSP